MNARFALAMARRELRASRRRLALYGACMALGIAALVGLHGARATLVRAVDAQARELLGADLHLASRAPLGEQLEAEVAALEHGSGRVAARVTQLGSMALAHRTGLTRLVDLRAVAGGFPFYGEIRTDPPGLWQALQAREDGALVDASLLLQLGVVVGDTLDIGSTRFEILGAITRAPGSVGLRTQIAPRVFVPHRALAATELLRPGSLVDYHTYLTVEPAPLAAWLEANRETFESERVRIQTVAGYQEELGRSFETLTRYLGLVGLVALALGGVGVAAGVRVLVREKRDAVAVLRSLGASSGDVLGAYGALALALGAVSGVAGALLGVGVQAALPRLLAGLLPVTLEVEIEPVAIATGFALGLWVTGLFALVPLFELGRVPPLRALRRDFGGEAAARGPAAVHAALLAGSLLAVSLWQAPTARIGLGFAAGLGAALALLAGTAQLVASLLRRRFPASAPYWLRQGISNLFRPRNHTLATTVALGFGLFLVATLQAVHTNVRAQMAVDARPDRPNLVVFDVQRDQEAELAALLAERGAPVIDRAPIVSARLARVGGRETSDWLREPDLDRERRWALRREYNLSYHDTPRDTETLVAGAWWPAEGPPADAVVPISLDDELASELGVGLDAHMVWDIQGVRLDTVVTSLRHIDWGRMAPNFFVVFPSAALADAPQSAFLLARHPDAGARAELQRDVVARFPNVSIIDASVMLAAFDAMHREMGTAVQVLSLLTLVTGFVILVAAAAAARSERRREALLLRTLGASAATVRRIVATEAIALGALAASVGTGLALLAAWTAVTLVFELDFAPPIADLALLAGGTVALSALLGMGGGGSGRRSPFAALRDAEAHGAA